MTENRKEQKMSMDKRMALKVTKKSILGYLEDEEDLTNDYRYFCYVKQETYSSDDLASMTLTQRRNLVSKADLVLLDTSTDAIYWIGNKATQEQLIDAFGDTKDAEPISLEAYLHQN
jgi:hypothetical protein